MNKKKAVLNLTKLAIAAKIAKCREIVTKLTGNPDFTMPNPSLAILTAKIDVLADAFLLSEQGSKLQKAVTREENLKLDILFRTLRDYVSEQAGGSEVKILSTGFDVSKDRTPPGALAKVTGLKCLTSEYTGTADLRWDKVNGAKAYFVQKLMETPEVVDSNGVLTASEGAWEIGAGCTKTRTNVENLESVRYYWFRVAAIGASGHSPWSDPGRTVVS